MCVCFGRVSLHCFTSCTPGIIYGPISSHCMGAASRWNYNGDCMIKIFQGAGVMTPSKPALFEQLSPLPTFTSFTATTLPIHHPFSPHKNVDHTLSCSAFYGVYNMSVVSTMFLYPSRKDGGLHRNCTLYTGVIRVPSAFLRKL